MQKGENGIHVNQFSFAQIIIFSMCLWPFNFLLNIKKTKTDIDIHLDEILPLVVHAWMNNMNRNQSTRKQGQRIWHRTSGTYLHISFTKFGNQNSHMHLKQTNDARGRGTLLENPLYTLWIHTMNKKVIYLYNGCLRTICTIRRVWLPTFCPIPWLLR